MCSNISFAFKVICFFLFISFCYIFPSSVSFADQQVTKEELQKEIEIINSRFDLVDKFNQLALDLKSDLEDDIKVGLEKLEIKITSDTIDMRNGHAKEMLDLRAEQKYYNNLTTILTLGVSLFLVIILGFIYTSIGKIITMKIDSFFKDKISTIRDMIDDRNTENIIKSKSSLLLLCDNQTEIDGMRDIIRRLSFENYETRKIEDVMDLSTGLINEGVNENVYDLVVFCHLSEDNIRKYLNNSLHNIFLAYTQPNTPRLGIATSKELLCATSLFTLYDRIMQILRFNSLTQGEL